MTTNNQTIQVLQIVEIQSTQIIIHTILGQNGDIPLSAKSSMTTKKYAAVVPENLAIGRFGLQLCFQLWPKPRNYMLEGSIAAFLQMRLQARTNGILQPHVSRAAIVFFFFFPAHMAQPHRPLEPLLHWILSHQTCKKSSIHLGSFPEGFLTW